MHSLRLRFLLLTVVTTLLVLSGSHMLLSSLFRTHVYQQIDTTLDNRLNQLLARIQVAPDGNVGIDTRGLSDPRWEKPYSGLYWQISAVPFSPESPLLRSRSLWDTRLNWIEDSITPGQRHYHDTEGPQQDTLRVVESTVVLETPPPTQWRLIVAESTATVEQAVNSFSRVLSVSLLVLMALIFAGAWLQWRWGLAPLHALATDLKCLRAGQALPSTHAYPTELQPLVRALSRVLELNARMVDSAKTQAGNLAHALKTPLAVMRNTSEQINERHVREVMLNQLETADRHIQWHLTKARAQANFAASSETIDVLSSIAGLIRVMQKLHPAVVVNLKKVEEVDHAHAWLRGEISIFQDMVGNLLDNACRFARHKVNVTISASQELCIAIDDDGPGITPAQRVSVLRRGERLDESSPGSGLGLTISADLAELFGGKLLLEDSPLGGLRVRLLIPKATQEES